VLLQFLVAEQLRPMDRLTPPSGQTLPVNQLVVKMADKATTPIAGQLFGRWPCVNARPSASPTVAHSCRLLNLLADAASRSFLEKIPPR
jgi:hypothetical protein